AIQKVTGAPPYTGKLDDIKDTAYRVIADHIRALTFAITDGAEPSNTKRGFVLRSILRRAERYGWQHVGTTKPFLCDLVPTVVEIMGGVFPELTRNPQRVIDVVREEEKSFLATLDRGLKLFNDAAARVPKPGGDTLGGEDAFKLHDTCGVFIDITEQMAAESGLKVDRAGYQELMDQAKRKAREAQKRHIVTAVSGELPKANDDAKYNSAEITAKVVGWVAGNEVVRKGKLSGE